jgi:hypothetical protein
VHSFFLTVTPPPLRCENAFVGQISAQGVGLQAKQDFASKLVDSPPEETMRMPAASQDNFL